MVGMRMVVAPRASSWVARSEAWWRVLVMRMRLLVRGGTVAILVLGLSVLSENKQQQANAGVLPHSTRSGSGCQVLGGDRRTGKSKCNGTDKCKSKIRGFFAALRMTGVLVG